MLLDSLEQKKITKSEPQDLIVNLFPTVQCQNLTQICELQGHVLNLTEIFHLATYP